MGDITWRGKPLHQVEGTETWCSNDIAPFSSVIVELRNDGFHADIMSTMSDVRYWYGFGSTAQSALEAAVSSGYPVFKARMARLHEFELKLDELMTEVE